MKKLLLHSSIRLLLLSLLASFLAISFSPSALGSINSSITSVGIIENTLAGLPNCTHYKIKGICFWLKCDGICQIQTTFNVDQYLPDAVETVFMCWRYALYLAVIFFLAQLYALFGQTQSLVAREH